MRTIKQVVIELAPGEEIIIRSNGASITVEASEVDGDDSLGSSLFVSSEDHGGVNWSHGCDAGNQTEITVTPRQYTQVMFIGQ